MKNFSKHRRWKNDRTTLAFFTFKFLWNTETELKDATNLID